MFHLSVFNFIPCLVAHDFLFYFENGPVGVSLTFLWWSSFPALIVSTCSPLPGVCIYCQHLSLSCLSSQRSCHRASLPSWFLCLRCYFVIFCYHCVHLMFDAFISFFVFDCFSFPKEWLVVVIRVGHSPFVRVILSWTPCLRPAIGSVVTRQNKNKMFRQNVKKKKKKTFIAVVMLRKPERYKHPGKCSRWVQVSNQITFKINMEQCCVVCLTFEQWYFWNNRYK